MGRILYLGGFELPDKNAAALRVMANAKLLREMGHDVYFIGITKDGVCHREVYDGFSCESIKYPVNVRDWLRYITTFVTGKTISSYDPDYVILYNFPAIASLRILRFCHHNGIKVIHDITEWEQTDGYSARDFIKRADTCLRMRYCVKKMDGVIAISRFLYDYYRKKTTTILVPPTVDLKDDKWNQDRNLMPSGRVRLIYAGSANSTSKDRLDTIVNSVSRLGNLELTILGMTEDKYEAVFGPLPQEHDNISFMGRVPHEEAVKAVRGADFQMLIRYDSRKNRAGFPTKFVESISCHTPVIATLSSNLIDYLVDGKNGFIVDDSRPLDSVLERVSNLSIEDRSQMKRYCGDNNAFDYRCYKDEFSKLFTE